MTMMERKDLEKNYLTYLCAIDFSSTHVIY